MLTRSLLSCESPTKSWQRSYHPEVIDKSTLDALPQGVLQTEEIKAGPPSEQRDSLLDWGFWVEGRDLPVLVFPNFILSGDAEERGEVSISHLKDSPYICRPYLHGNYTETA